MNSLHVGKKYDNLTDFMNDLENYEKENYVSFTKKDSMTIDRSKVANPKNGLNLSWNITCYTFYVNKAARIEVVQRQGRDPTNILQK